MKGLLLLITVLSTINVGLTQNLEYKILADLNDATEDKKFDAWLKTPTSQIFLVFENSTNPVTNTAVFTTIRNGQYIELCRINLNNYLSNNAEHSTNSVLPTYNNTKYLQNGRTNEIIFRIGTSYFTVNTTNGNYRLIKNFQSPGRSFEEFIVLGDKIIGKYYSNGYNEGPYVGEELFALNIDSGHFYLVKDIEGWEQLSSKPSNFKKVEEKIYFRATKWDVRPDDPTGLTTKDEIWVTDGTFGGTNKVTEYGVEKRYFTDVSKFNNGVIFAEQGPETNYKAQNIYKYDATTKITTKILDERAFNITTQNQLDIVSLKKLASNIIILVQRYNQYGYETHKEIWVSGGSNESTSYVSTFYRTAFENGEIAVFNGNIFFTYGPNSFDLKLYKYDGQYVSPVSNKSFSGIAFDSNADRFKAQMISCTKSSEILIPTYGYSLAINLNEDVLVKNLKSSADVTNGSLSYYEKSYPFVENNKFYWYFKPTASKYGHEIYNINNEFLNTVSDLNANTKAFYPELISTINGTAILHGTTFSNITGQNQNTVFRYDGIKKSAVNTTINPNDFVRNFNDLFLVKESNYYPYNLILSKLDFDNHAIVETDNLTSRYTFESFSIDGKAHFQSKYKNYSQNKSYELFSIENEKLVVKYDLDFLPTYTTIISGQYYFVNYDNNTRKLELHEGNSSGEVRLIDTIVLSTNYYFTKESFEKIGNKIISKEIVDNLISVLVFNPVDQSHKSFYYTMNSDQSMMIAGSKSDKIYIETSTYSPVGTIRELFRFGLTEKDSLKYNFSTTGYSSFLSTYNEEGLILSTQKQNIPGTIKVLQLKHSDNSLIEQDYQIEEPALRYSEMLSIGCIKNDLFYVQQSRDSPKSIINIGHIDLENGSSRLIDKIQDDYTNGYFSRQMPKLNDEELLLFVNNPIHGEEIYTIRFCSDNATLTGIVNGNYIKSSTTIISSNEQIYGNNKSIYIAPKSIELTPGFIANEGIFETIIGTRTCEVTQ